MNCVFADDGALAEPMKRLLFVLNDNEHSHIVLAEADDEVVRQEAMAELGERLNGKYRIAEFNYARPPLPSLMRYYRQQSAKPPVCLFAYGMEVLKARRPEEYSDALHFLNAHREDSWTAPGAVVLWLTTSTFKDVLIQAPDFSDWATSGITFALPDGERIERTALGRLSVTEAEELRHNTERFREMLSRPNLGEPLRVEFSKQLDWAERRLGRIVDVRRDYKLYLADELREHVLRGFAPQVGGRVLSLPLGKIFLPLQAVEGRPALAQYAAEDLAWQEEAAQTDELDWHYRREEMEKRQARLRERRTTQRTLSLEDLLRERRAVLLGDPGSGKSTVSRYVAWALATEDLTKVGNTLAGRLPIYVRLASFGKALESEGGLTLLDYVESRLFPRQPAFGPCLREAVTDGNCLVLLDGLDEVTDTSLRVETAQRIQELVRDFPANRFLVTSRIVGYERTSLTQDFRHATLQELGSDDRKRFVQLWRAAIRSEIGDSGAALPESDLVADLKARPQIARMASNPLLLTILVLMHWRGVKLPSRRAQVYQSTTDTLIEHWTAERVMLDAEEVKQILAPIAYYILSSNVGGVIARRDLLPRLREGIEVHRGLRTEEAEGVCEELLTHLGEQSGIFLERGLDASGQPVYGFLHQTFGEYFAALHLANEFLGGAFEIGDYVHRSVWKEPLLLLAGHLSLSSPAPVTQLLRSILNYPCPYEDVLRRNVLLAAECLADDVQVLPEVRDEILRRLAETLLHMASSPRDAAVKIYRFLGRTRYRSLAVEAVEQAWEEWKSVKPDSGRYWHPTIKAAITLATARALVRLNEFASAATLLGRLKGLEGLPLYFEIDPTEGEKRLQQHADWIHLNHDSQIGDDLTSSTIGGMSAEDIRQSLGTDRFIRMLDELQGHERNKTWNRPFFQWLKLLSMESPPNEELLSLATSKDVLFEIGILAAGRLLSTEHRSTALSALRAIAPYRPGPVGNLLLKNDAPGWIDWDLICNLAFTPPYGRAPEVIELLFKAGRRTIAVAAAIHVFATGWIRERTYWDSSDEFIQILRILFDAEETDVAIATAEWLALLPGYTYRLEACEVLLNAGHVENAVQLLKHVALECHGEASLKACELLLKFKENARETAQVLNSLKDSEVPDIEYSAAMALALVNEGAQVVPLSPRALMKASVADERNKAYRAALDRLYDVGNSALNTSDPRNAQAALALGRFSLHSLCRNTEPGKPAIGSPAKGEDDLPGISLGWALLAWRYGHRELARSSLTGIMNRLETSLHLQILSSLQITGSAFRDDAIPTLEFYANHEEAQFREMAIRALGNLLSKEVTSALVNALNDRSPEVRGEATAALTSFHDRNFEQVLSKKLCDGQPHMRAHVVKFLGQLGGPAAIHKICNAYGDKDWYVRLEVVRALQNVDDPLGTEVLISALEDTALEVRRAAVRALVGSHQSVAILALSTVMKNDDPHLRIEAAEAMARSGVSDGIEELIRILLSQDAQIAQAASSALGRLSGCRVTEDLIETLASSTKAARKYVLSALAQQGNPVAETVLTEILQSRDEEEKSLAARALGNIGTLSALDTLLATTEDESSKVRASVMAALGKIVNPRAQQAIVAGWRDKAASVRLASIQALSGAPRQLLEKILRKALKDKNSSIRRSAVWALSRAPGRDAIPDLTLSLSDEDTEVRRLGASLVRRMNPADAKPLLIPLVGDEDISVRMETCKALARLRSPGTAPYLMALLNDSEGVVRAEAARALGRWRHVPAYERLVAALRDPSMNVRAATARALGRFGSADAARQLLFAAVQTLSTAFQKSTGGPDNPTDAFASMVLALVRLEAKQFFPQLLAMAVPHPDYLKAVLAFEVRSAEQVLRRYETAFEGWSWLHLLQGHAAWTRGRLDEAEGAFHKAVEGGSSFPDLWLESRVEPRLSLALLSLERGNLQKASKHVDRALDQVHRAPGGSYAAALCLLARAVVLRRRKELPKALESLEEALSEDPFVADLGDLRFERLWRPDVLAVVEELLGYVERTDVSIPWSEVAEPQVVYDGDPLGSGSDL